MVNVRSRSVGDDMTTMEVDKLSMLLIPPDSSLPEWQKTDYSAIKTSSDDNCLFNVLSLPFGIAGINMRLQVLFSSYNCEQTIIATAVDVRKPYERRSRNLR